MRCWKLVLKIDGGCHYNSLGQPCSLELGEGELGFQWCQSRVLRTCRFAKDMGKMRSRGRSSVNRVNHKRTVGGHTGWGDAGDATDDEFGEGFARIELSKDGQEAAAA